MYDVVSEIARKIARLKQNFVTIKENSIAKRTVFIQIPLAKEAVKKRRE
jgi:hypothetical protein